MCELRRTPPGRTQPHPPHLTANHDLARDYIRRAQARLYALDALFDQESWADVVRESQEVVELALKALLRSAGIEPPRIHDVADVLIAEQERLPEALHPDVPQLAFPRAEQRKGQLTATSRAR